MAKQIPTGWDIEAEPDADEFDPIGWFLGTGEDLGVPPEWKAAYEADLAKSLEELVVES